MVPYAMQGMGFSDNEKGENIKALIDGNLERSQERVFDDFEFYISTDSFIKTEGNVLGLRAVSMKAGEFEICYVFEESGALKLQKNLYKIRGDPRLNLDYRLPREDKSAVLIFH